MSRPTLDGKEIIDYNKGMAVINRALGAIFARLFTLFFLLFSGILGIYAQDSSSIDNVFAPFVSQLSIETRNNLVRLSWVDSTDVKGLVYIYRAARPFSEANLAALHPEVVPYGTQNFVDDVEGSGSIYYFVAASDDQGQRYDKLIPYTNIIVLHSSGGVSTTSGNFSHAASGTPVPSEFMPQTMAYSNENYRSSQVIVSGLTATPDADKVIISFAITGGQKNTILFRSTQPIRNVHDLINSINLATNVSSPYIDYPIPGFTYYYALVFRDDISLGTETIQPGRNATIYPAEVNGGIGSVTGIRSMPLPGLTIYRTSPEQDFYSELPNRSTRLRPETARSLDTSPRIQPTPPPVKRPRVFAVDLEVPAGGEDSALCAIVQGSFAKRDWVNAREELFRYLALSRAAAVEARARFYLGQTYYFTGNGREALVEFLFVQSRYPTEANEWIEAVLTGLVN